MARHEHLPIYRDALALTVHFEQNVAGFTRYHKYTLGTELRNASRRTVSPIIQANIQSDKHAGLIALRDPYNRSSTFKDSFLACSRYTLKSSNVAKWPPFQPHSDTNISKGIAR